MPYDDNPTVTIPRPPRCAALIRLDAKISYWDEHGSRLLQIPDAYRKQPLIGTVVAVGEPYRDDTGKAFAMGLQVGERVYLGPYNGDVVELGDEHEYRLCRGYSHDPNLQQAHVREAIEEPETAFPDVYAMIENDDGTPYAGTPSRAEVREWLDRVLGRGEP